VPAWISLRQKNLKSKNVLYTPGIRWLKLKKDVISIVLAACFPSKRTRSLSFYSLRCEGVKREQGILKRNWNLQIPRTNTSLADNLISRENCSKSESQLTPGTIHVILSWRSEWQHQLTVANNVNPLLRDQLFNYRTKTEMICLDYWVLGRTCRKH
jgi:hypothetical protein